MVAKKEEEKKTGFALGRENYKLMAIGFAVIIVGALMNTRMTAQYIEVNIEGFPARYSKIRRATREDLWMLDFINYGNKSKNTDAIKK